MKAFVFPGQGAQFSGMGKDLYNSHPLAKEMFEKALLKKGATRKIWFDPQIELFAPQYLLAELKNLSKPMLHNQQYLSTR